MIEWNYIYCVNYVSVDLLWFQDFIECLSHDMPLHGGLIWSRRLAKVFPATQIGWAENNLCHITPQKTEFYLLHVPMQTLVFTLLQSLCSPGETTLTKLCTNGYKYSSSSGATESENLCNQT